LGAGDMLVRPHVVERFDVVALRTRYSSRQIKIAFLNCDFESHVKAAGNPLNVNRT
jgi:hypothetical protein